MNLFLIPSWYPHAAEPTDGIFLKEQALAIAHERAEWNVAVSLWGQGRLKLSIRDRKRLLPFVRAAVAPRGQTAVRLLPNLVEFETPRLTWSPRLAHGRINTIVEANRANVAASKAEFGPIDLIHAHVSFPGGYVARVLSRELDVPYVVTEHVSPFPFPVFLDRNGNLDTALRDALRDASVRIAVSQALALELERFDIGDVTVVPNLVDESVFAPGEHEPHDRFVFFSLGRLEPRKGFPDLLAAAAQVEAPFVLRIGGVGPDERALRRQAADLGIEKNIDWLGSLTRAQVREELQRCDCFVLASRRESFGVVYAEAAACGRPVVATRSGGPETIVTPETGVLVDVADRAALAQALNRVVTTEFDPAVIRAKFLERYSRRAVVDRLDDVYAAARG